MVSAIDTVPMKRAQVIEHMLNFLRTDTVWYVFVVTCVVAVASVVAVVFVEKIGFIPVVFS